MTKKNNNQSEWKPLKLEGSVFLSGVDDLIGIEELTDYNLEQGKSKTKIVINNEKSENEEKKVSKRKSSSKWLENDITENEPAKKKAKLKKLNEKNVKTKKKKKPIAKDVTVSQDDLVHNIKDESQLNDKASDTEDNEYNIDVQAWSALGVPNPVIKALNDQQFHVPTTIQALTLPPAILGHRDILGAAETGSGKTLAFGIPIINGILQSKSKEPNKSDAEEFTEGKKNGKVNKGWVCSENQTKEEEDDDVDSLVASDLEEDLENLDKQGIGCVRVIDNIKFNETESYPNKPLYALILTPTRELAIQIKDHLTRAAKYTDIRIAVVLGGMAAVKQERILSKGPEIVIATPGRLWELIQQGNPHLNQVNSIKYLAIDETDRMLERGHFQELQQLLEKINMDENKVKERQTFVFSATLTLVHDLPNYLIKKKRKSFKSRIQKLTTGKKLQEIIELVGIKNPKIVDVTKQSGTASNLTECRIACTIDHKDYYLYYFLKRHSGRTLVFCNSIGCVKRLATLFGILECRPLPLHASMQQRQRLKNLERFQADEDGLLIATDVAARGLDIPNVEHVIHYQVPRTSESYVHRSGRTARAQKEGITVLMMEPSEKEYYSKLCKTLGRTQDLPVFPVVDRLLIAVKERVDVAREIDKLELQSRRDNSQKGWFRKAAEDMDIILDDDMDEEEATEEAREMADLNRDLKIKKRKLASLIAKPLFPKGFSGKYPDINAKLNLPAENQKAVDVMKKAIEEIPKRKKEESKKSRNKRSIFKKKLHKNKVAKKHQK